MNREGSKKHASKPTTWEYLIAKCYFSLFYLLMTFTQQRGRLQSEQVIIKRDSSYSIDNALGKYPYEAVNCIFYLFYSNVPEEISQ